MAEPAGAPPQALSVNLTLYQPAAGLSWMILVVVAVTPHFSTSIVDGMVSVLPPQATTTKLKLMILSVATG